MGELKNSFAAHGLSGPFGNGVMLQQGGQRKTPFVQEEKQEAET